MELNAVKSFSGREEPFSLLFDSNPVPMWLHDPVSLKFLGVNEAAVAHYGYSKETFLAMNLVDIVPQDQRETIKKGICDNPHLQQGAGQVWRHIKADGSKIDVLTSWRDIVFRDTPAQLVAVMDVTEKRKAEKRISYMTCHDSLTDLPNRLLFQEHVDEALLRVHRGNEKLAIHHFDLDHFKDVNDRLGHATGDKLLVAVASRLRSHVRAGDIVARLGGNEFAILQVALAGLNEAHALAERIEKLTSEPYDIEGQQVRCGASVGIAFAPADGETSDDLLRNADLALRRAKEDGGGTFRYFEPGMDANLRARQALEADLREALGHSEFHLVYQPIISVESGDIAGFEALLRWHSSKRGMMFPATFIPLAEETGLIIQLGQWVLREACAEAASWPREWTLAVNLSPAQFKAGNLPHQVQAILARSGLPAARLQLEITETVLLEDSKTNLAILRDLRALGAGISLDDFGAGNSSLNYLRNFVFDKIKIDRSFVDEIGERPECLAIVRAVAQLAADLGIPTVAEGVETEEHRELICQAGCTEMQGYLLGRPIPASAIKELLDAHGGKAQPPEKCLAGAD